MCKDNQACTECCKGKNKFFSDKAAYDSVNKTVISVRDGVQEYLGIELGMPDANKMYKVFRSRQTIMDLAERMAEIPVTENHVSLDHAPINPIGETIDSEFLNYVDRSTSTTGVIRNRLKVSDNVVRLVANGKSELSLGYQADLLPHDQYDFEQTNIRPHHLAVLESGRCGEVCSFQDTKEKHVKNGKLKKLLKTFADQDGMVTLQQLVELVAALPEAIKNVPMDQLQDLAPALMSVVEAAKAAGVEIPMEEKPKEKPAEQPPAGDKSPEEKAAMDKAAADKAATDKAADAAAKTNDGKPTFSDEDLKKKIGLAVNDAIAQHSSAVEKAKKFVDASYNFEGKTTMQIMRDAIATQTTDKFSDEEIITAFKLLKPKAPNYANFGDGAIDPFATIRNKEI